MNLFKQVLPALESSIEKSGEMLAFSSDSSLLPVPLDAKYFHTPGFFQAEREITAVDGGNAELVSAAQLSLQFIRVAAVTYLGKQHIRSLKKEFFCLVTTDGSTYTCSLFGDAPFSSLSFPARLKTLDGQVTDLDISQVGGMVRRLSELKLASELPDGFMVIDGNSRSQTSQEEALIKKILQRTSPTGFLSKTCRLLTKNGKSLAVALHELGPKGTWWYHPVFKQSPLHFAHLYSSSRYVFGLDVAEHAEKESFIATLCQQSSDPVFLGYPYCLIAADQLARVSNEEKDYLKTRILAQVKNKEKLEMLLSTLDAHGVLDRIR
ncbi:MAG: hypothetical protein Q7S65_01725 [Nanoarchaeota archaeon]|nr:hypothetical protein [Nanoarchaeota archaeon]